MDLIHWLVLVTSISGQNGTLRVRLWRQMKALGAATLRDGVYLVPARRELKQALINMRDELLASEGLAYLLQVAEDNPALQAEWKALFDRSEDYRQWEVDVSAFLAQLPESESEARRGLRQLRKDLEGLAATDFFAGSALEQARRQCNEAEKRLTRHYSPDEPLAIETGISKLHVGDYQHRTWATRARPWVDRVASAWLIRRFIDPHARFAWLADIHDCPADALGFDYDGAAFTHVGERVTFEVLLASFGLAEDAALVRLGDMVHVLDIGGAAVPEATGFEAILGGARRRIEDDDRLLEEISGVLDSFYAHYQSQGKS